jgi:RNA polymerase sigma-70 factor (ECF subfamily)
MLNAQPDDHESADTWELEYQRRLASLAMERIQSEFQEKSWRAFWQTAVEGQAAGEVSKQLGLSAGAIYVAKSRVLARLKEEVEAMQRQEDN